MAVKNFNEVEGTTQGIRNTRIFRGHSTVGRTFADSKVYDIELVKQDMLIKQKLFLLHLMAKHIMDLKVIP